MGTQLKVRAPMFGKLVQKIPTAFRNFPFYVAFNEWSIQNGANVLRYPAQQEGYAQSLGELLVFRKEMAMRALNASNELCFYERKNRDKYGGDVRVKIVYIVEAPHYVVRLSDADTCVDLAMRSSVPLCKSSCPGEDGIILSVDRNYLDDAVRKRRQEVVFVPDAIAKRVEIWDKFGQEFLNQKNDASPQRLLATVKVPHYAIVGFSVPVEMEGLDDRGILYLPMSQVSLTNKQIDDFLFPQRPQEAPIQITSRGYIKVDDHYAPVSQ
ncbi:MAG: hypothetical protein EOM37_02020 [Proteobacteria bacterium]|nr:hypothetical protein [Alphaproteobacteria bacterium]NCC02812.1 hypothetical protein [Pseudomonadota bacterium]